MTTLRPSAGLLLGIALLAVGCAKRNNPPPTADRVVTVCSGCGTKWWAQGGEPIEPINKCPNCPMSHEELAELID